jgi:predicted nucleotidyltransferase
MKFGLKEKVINQINNVFAKYPQIEKVLIYGSRAKGNYKTGSDIDLSLVGKNIDLALMQAIELKIDDLLLPYTFDISIYNQISNQDVKDHIERVGLEFYRADQLNE